MYVCICQAITDRQIERAVDAGLDTVDALRDNLGVASCCGSCETTAEAIVAERRAAASAAQPVIYRPASQAI